MQPLEALLKLGKAGHIVEDLKVAGSNWLKVDILLCQSLIHYLMMDTVNAVGLLKTHCSSSEGTGDICKLLGEMYERGTELVISTGKKRAEDSLVVSNWTSSCSSNTPPNGKDLATIAKSEETVTCPLCLAEEEIVAKLNQEDPLV